uniref:Uncharacterized protein n=1 Tax=Arundo donax TaxID=35708 RepID=A0A0A9GLE1_ARUDO
MFSFRATTFHCWRKTNLCKKRNQIWIQLRTMRPRMCTPCRSMRTRTMAYCQRVDHL